MMKHECFSGSLQGGTSDYYDCLGSKSVPEIHGATGLPWSLQQIGGGETACISFRDKGAKPMEGFKI